MLKNWFLFSFIQNNFQVVGGTEGMAEGMAEDMVVDSEDMEVNLIFF